MQIIKLSNGLTFIYYPISNAQSVEIGLYVKAGSRYETKSNNGITHLLEHMHFRQLGNMSQEEIYKQTECMGTSLRATTYKDMMCFYMKIRPRYLGKSLVFFENILNTFDWEEEQLISEKRTVLNEICENRSRLIRQTIVDETIWSNHSLSQQILGNEEIIERISLEEVIRYKKEVFCKDNVALVITGAVNDNDIESIINRFDSIPLSTNKMSIMNNYATVQFNRKFNIVLENYSSWELLDVQLSFDVNLELIQENELLFLNSILGGGDGSILQKEIREKVGMVYEIYSEIEPFSKEAMLSIIFSIDKKNLEGALKKIMEILDRLKKNISQTDMNMNRVFFTENLWFWLEDSYELNRQLGYDFVRGKEPLSIENRIKVNENISSSRLEEVADIIFQPSNMSLIIMGPTKRIKYKRLKEILYKQQV